MKLRCCWQADDWVRGFHNRGSAAPRCEAEMGILLFHLGLKETSSKAETGAA